jgi:hypothetical protein
LIDLCGERDTSELSRELNGRARVETNRDFGPLSQELGRLAYSIDEGSLREGEIFNIQENIVIAIAIGVDVVAPLGRREMMIYQNRLPMSLYKGKVVGDKGKENKPMGTCSEAYQAALRTPQENYVIQRTYCVYFNCLVL